MNRKDRLTLARSASHKLLNLKVKENPLHMFLEPRQNIISKEVKDLENFYFSSMLDAYHQSNRKLPDPVRILELIKQKDRLLRISQRQKQNLQQTTKYQQSLGELLRNKYQSSEKSIESYSYEQNDEYRIFLSKIKIKLKKLLKDIGVDTKKIKIIEETPEFHILDEFAHQLRLFTRELENEKKSLQYGLQQRKKMQESQNIQLLQLQKVLSDCINQGTQHDNKLKEQLRNLIKENKEIKKKDVQISRLKIKLIQTEELIEKKQEMILHLKNSIEEAEKMIQQEGRLSELSAPSSPCSLKHRHSFLSQFDRKESLTLMKESTQCSLNKQLNTVTDWKKMMDKTVNAYEDQLTKKNVQIQKHCKKIDKYKKKLYKLHSFLEENIQSY